MDTEGRLSRRDFIKIGSATVAGVATTGLVGCAGASQGAQGADSATASIVDPLAKPAEVPSSEIKETKKYDIVVVGAGMAGVCAALAAIENGAKVAVLQKASMALTHGNFISAINVPELLKAGCQKIDTDAMRVTLNDASACYPNWQLLARYFKESPESGSWLLARAAEAGAKAIIPAPVPAIKFDGKIIAGVTALAKLAKSKGVEFFYETPGKQLIKEADGSISGVLAKDGSGQYLKFMASKGVILATGDYGNNRDLQKKYCPGALSFESFYAPAINDGDGHLMGMWVGAAMQESAHPKMVHVHHFVGDGDKNAPMRKAPWLNINDYGDRFMNENIRYEYRCNAAVRYPHSHATQIFDAKHETYYKKMPNQSDPAVDGTLEDFIKLGLLSRPIHSMNLRSSLRFRQIVSRQP